MGFLGAITKIAASPIKAIAEVVDDVSGQNGDDGVFLSIATLGIGPAVRGIAKAVKEASEEVFKD